MKRNAILCVDDEPQFLESLKEVLKHHYRDRFLYETSPNAIEAMETLDEMVAEGIQEILIISDFQMPGMKGDEFLIQVHRKFPQITAIMVTGCADVQAIERTRAKGNLCACLQKPIQAAELITLIDEMLPASK